MGNFGSGRRIFRVLFVATPRTVTVDVYLTFAKDRQLELGAVATKLPKSTKPSPPLHQEGPAQNGSSRKNDPPKMYRPGEQHPVGLPRDSSATGKFVTDVCRESQYYRIVVESQRCFDSSRRKDAEASSHSKEKVYERFQNSGTARARRIPRCFSDPRRYILRNSFPRSRNHGPKPAGPAGRTVPDGGTGRNPVGADEATHRRGGDGRAAQGPGGLGRGDSQR